MAGFFFFNIIANENAIAFLAEFFEFFYCSFACSKIGETITFGDLGKPMSPGATSFTGFELPDELRF